MDVYIIAIAYYSVLIIGLGGLIVGAGYVSMKAYEALLTQFKFYDEFIRFIYDRRRKEPKVFTPTINRKEDDE